MKKKILKRLDPLATWLVIIGAINWGLVALGINLVELILGSIPILVTVVYSAVGISGIIKIINTLK